MRRTKIVATIGPASDPPEVLRRLVGAGLDVARVNLAHGTPDEHRQRVARIREAADAAGRTVGVLADLPGPKIRAGVLEPDGGVLLAEGDPLTLVPGDGSSSPGLITVDYDGLLDDVGPGDTITLGDGAVSVAVEGVAAGRVGAVVRTGGRLQGRPGVHLPTERLRLTSPTPQDLDLLQVALGAGVDLVAVSFVRSAADVAKVRSAAGEGGPMLVAKVETPDAVNRLAEIIDEADAVMVARGDLGIACPIEDVPHLQKRIIRTCVAWGRPVITATQMLESMVHAPTPTRAEVTDVANAVFDGTDALMLSAETAIGHDPVAVVRTMDRLARRAERDADYVQWGGRLGKIQRLEALPRSLAITGAVTHAAWQAAQSVDAAAIICCTRSGATARAMARFRPVAPLVAASPDPRTARQLALTWGVQPMVVPEQATTDDLVWASVERAVAEGFVAAGDVVGVLAGTLSDPEPVTDQLRLVRVR